MKMSTVNGLKDDAGVLTRACNDGKLPWRPKGLRALLVPEITQTLIDHCSASFIIPPSQLRVKICDLTVLARFVAQNSLDSGKETLPVVQVTFWL